jgi:hypothetical protein
MSVESPAGFLVKFPEKPPVEPPAVPSADSGVESRTSYAEAQLDQGHQLATRTSALTSKRDIEPASAEEPRPVKVFRTSFL